MQHKLYWDTGHLTSSYYMREFPAVQRNATAAIQELMQANWLCTRTTLLLNRRYLQIGLPVALLLHCTASFPGQDQHEMYPLIAHSAGQMWPCTESPCLSRPPAATRISKLLNHPFAIQHRTDAGF